MLRATEEIENIPEDKSFKKIPILSVSSFLLLLPILVVTLSYLFNFSSIHLSASLVLGEEKMLVSFSCFTRNRKQTAPDRTLFTLLHTFLPSSLSSHYVRTTLLIPSTPLLLTNLISPNWFARENEFYPPLLYGISYEFYRYYRLGRWISIFSTIIRLILKKIDLFFSLSKKKSQNLNYNIVISRWSAQLFLINHPKYFDRARSGLIINGQRTGWKRVWFPESKPSSTLETNHTPGKSRVI